MSIELEALSTYFKQYGWEYEISEEQFLITGFRGKSNIFRVFVQPTEHWVIFAIVPFVTQPIPECRERLCYFITRLNYEMSLAKISMDEDGDIVLSIEMRAQDLRFEDFSEALDALAFYADAYYLTLTNLAIDPNYNSDTQWEAWGAFKNE